MPEQLMAYAEPHALKLVWQGVLFLVLRCGMIVKGIFTSENLSGLAKHLDAAHQPGTHLDSGVPY